MRGDPNDEKSQPWADLGEGGPTWETAGAKALRWDQACVVVVQEKPWRVEAQRVGRGTRWKRWGQAAGQQCSLFSFQINNESLSAHLCLTHCPLHITCECWLSDLDVEAGHRERGQG